MVCSLSKKAPVPKGDMTGSFGMLANGDLAPEMDRPKALSQTAKTSRMWTDTRARYAMEIGQAMWSLRMAILVEPHREYWLRCARGWIELARHTRRTTPRRRFSLP